MAPFENLGAVSYSTSILLRRYLVSFASDLLGRNSRNFIPHFYLTPHRGWPRRNFAKMLANYKARMIGLPCVWWRNYMTICEDISVEYRNVTDWQTELQTDRRTDRIAISISRVNMLTRDKNCPLNKSSRRLWVYVQGHNVFLMLHVV